MWWRNGKRQAKPVAFVFEPGSAGRFGVEMDDIVKRLQVTVPNSELNAAAAAEIECLRELVRRALPMADALDATKTAVVWTGNMQIDATYLARAMRAVLKA